MAKVTKNRVLHFIFDVSMSNGHHGLKLLAQKEKINVDTLMPGQFVLFLNKAFTACKLFAANNVVLHYKTPHNRALNVHALKLLPHFYDGTDIGYDRALKQVLVSMFRQRYPDE